MGKLTTKLRSGNKPHKYITLRDDIKAAVVILPLNIIMQIEELTEKYMTDNEGKANETTRTHYFNSLLCFHCLRDADDPSLDTKLADSIEEVNSELDVEDINRVSNAYSELMMDKSPKLELLTHDEFEELKKYLEVTPLTDLSTVLLVHLVNCHQSIVSKQ